MERGCASSARVARPSGQKAPDLSGIAEMNRLEKFYKDEVVPKLMKQFGYTNPMQVPKLTKITLNMGVGEAATNKKILENAVADMAKIAGQKPVVTKSRVSVASFK